MKRTRHLRNSSQNNLIELLPNTETYKNSYFCRTVKDWNALPSEIVDIKSADQFKMSFLSILANDDFFIFLILSFLSFVGDFIKASIFNFMYLVKRLA